MRIVFFNHYHNGDIFASKGYISDLIKEFNGHEIFYQHYHSPKLLRDLNIEYRSLELPLGAFTDRTPMAGDKNSIYVNTWIGNYLSNDNGINWNTYYSMFEKIYSALSDVNDRTIPMGNVEYYFPEIKYEYFDLPDFNVPKNTVIISNGPVLSGQSNLENMNKVIQLILDNTNKNIILTHFAPFNSERVAYTNNIIETSGGDLNEIAWLAEQCDYIIGRNSGPFCFMTNKSILNNSNKNIISIGNNEKDSFLYNISVNAKYHFINDNDSEKILEYIK